MGYTAVRGGLAAIEHAEALIEAMPVNSDDPLRVTQIRRHLEIASGQVMACGGVIDAELAALAIKQAEGDLVEAAFLLRAYRSTLPRLGYSDTTSGDEMLVLRRISSVFRDIPGGQLLGLTRDYTQRLLNFDLLKDAPALSAHANGARSDRGSADGATDRDLSQGADVPHDWNPLPAVIGYLRGEGLLAPAPSRAAGRDEAPFDVTRTPLRFPLPRSGRLQVLARGEPGGMLMLAYSSMRGFGGQGHGSLAELRYGELPVRISHPITGRPVLLGRVAATEVHYVSGGHASLQEARQADYRLGYGLVAGRDERKAISMAIIDASLRYAKPNDTQPVANQEFVLSHVDAIESSGFVEHLKLPHYVTFQAGLQRSRKFRELAEASSRG